ncbi:MAG: peptide chain release factor N(5)-glutamine methyltransferase [Mycoplasma sp.]|nr:peptide chain release factor N(5)-glutamine methyltransferase [Mycoplasma sp.]
MNIKFLKLKYKKDFYLKDMKNMILESKEELNKLKLGVPLHKILGYIEMTDVKIYVNKDVLIPRYETEELVLLASKYIDSNKKVLDLCSGSGYIALAIKKMTNANVYASDISKESIEQIKINAKRNKLDIKIFQSDLFNNINEKFDLIISNPPYIPKNNKLDKSVTLYEPSISLFGGEDGNEFYKKICNQYKKFLNKNGKIFFEISEDNVEYLITQKFKIINDINGKKRFAYK